MSELEIRQDMRDAAGEDRDRFFAVADTLHLQPKYRTYVVSGELEAVKQQWRDMTKLPDYPNIDFPLAIPTWFPRVRLASGWKKDTYIAETLKRAEEDRARQAEMKKLEDECARQDELLGLNSYGNNNN